MGDNEGVQRYWQESLLIREELGDRWAVASSLNNLGMLANDLGRYAEARALLERSLVIWREIGERWATANTLHNLANVAREEGDAAAASRLYADSIARWRELDDRWGIAYWLEDVALYRAARGDGEDAYRLMGAAAGLRQAIGVPRPPAYQARLDERLGRDANGIDAAAQQALQEAGRGLTLDEAVALL
jgi:hypothetical protein